MTTPPKIPTISDARPLRGGQAVKLRTADGMELRGEWLLPPSDIGEPRVTVALSHAMMVDRRTLDQPPGSGLLSQLVAAGAAVLWFDQRGHGQSWPLPDGGGSWDYDRLVSDAGVVASALAERFPNLPRVAVGHSLFGHVALAHQTKVSSGLMPWGYDRIVLLGANVWLRQLEPLSWRWWLKRAAFMALLATSQPLGYLPVRRLRLGTADEPIPYLAQMAQWLPRGDWDDRAGFSYLAALPRVTVPLLSVAGAGDRLLAVPECQLRLACRSSGPVTHITVGRRYGYGCDPDHMGLVLDARLQPLWREIAQWACRRTSAIVPPPLR